MGGIVSQLWWGGDPDAVDPLSGLTKRDIYAVQKSWALANANPITTGAEIFGRLFREYPETKELFKMIKNVPEHELVQNQEFKAHIVKLMQTITLAVNYLDQPEIVAAMMNKQGELHSMQNIQEKHFHDLKGVILKMFRQLLKLNDETLRSWEKTFEFWYKHIFEILNSDVTM